MKTHRKELIALRTGEKRPQRSGEYWTEEEQRSLQEMFEDGVDLSEIALRLGRNEIAIYQQLAKNGMLSQQCKSRTRRAKRQEGPSCLCSVCGVMSCTNCGKECSHAGNIR